MCEQGFTGSVLDITLSKEFTSHAYCQMVRCCEPRVVS